MADDQYSDDNFIALFNISDEEREVSFDLEWEMIRGKYRATDLWQKDKERIVSKKLSVRLGPHEGTIYRLRKIPKI